MNEKTHVPPVVRLLAGLLVFNVSAAIAVAKWGPDDSGVFQLLSNVSMTILGIMANQIMPDLKKLKPEIPPGTTTVVSQVTETPPIDPKP